MNELSLADCQFGLNYQADCLFQLITDHGLWVGMMVNCRDGMRWGCHSMPVDRQRRAQIRLDSSQVFFDGMKTAKRVAEICSGEESSQSRHDNKLRCIYLR
jgi:hypothetical protein